MCEESPCLESSGQPLLCRCQTIFMQLAITRMELEPWVTCKVRHYRLQGILSSWTCSGILLHLPFFKPIKVLSRAFTVLRHILGDVFWIWLQ